jgi:hypothetical protein
MCRDTCRADVPNLYATLRRCMHLFRNTAAGNSSGRSISVWAARASRNGWLVGPGPLPRASPMPAPICSVRQEYQRAWRLLHRMGCAKPRWRAIQGKVLRGNAFRPMTQVTNDDEANGVRLRSAGTAGAATRPVGSVTGGSIDLERAKCVAVTDLLCGTLGSPFRSGR